MRASSCETGPAPRQSQSTPSFCFLGKKPERPMAISWTNDRAGSQHTATVPVPPLWPEEPRSHDLTTGYLCVLLRDDSRASLVVTATAEACAVL